LAKLVKVPVVPFELPQAPNETASGNQCLKRKYEDGVQPMMDDDTDEPVEKRSKMC
jgi:hypothetical protein